MIPQLQLRCWTLSFTCLLLCNDKCLGWSRQCRNCGVPQLPLSLGQVVDMPAGVLTF